MIKTITIESEINGPNIGGELPYNDNTDVTVVLENGEKYWATYFTYENVELLIQRYKNNGGQLSGQYFWARNMILIEKIDRKLITESIEDLINDNCFYKAFEKIKPI